MVTYLVSARLKPEGTVQSCCVILGSITQSKYMYGGLEGGFLAQSPSSPPSRATLLSLQGSPSGSSLLARLSWTHPLSQLSFGCGKQRYLYFYKGELPVEGFLKFT